MKKLILILILAGLFGRIPVLAAEDCDAKIVPKEVVNGCGPKIEPIQQSNDRNECELKKNSTKNSIEEQNKLKKDAKEDNDILEELIKQ